MIAHVRKYSNEKCDCWAQIDKEDTPHYWTGWAVGRLPTGAPSNTTLFLEGDRAWDTFTIYSDDDPAVPDWVWAELMKRELTS